MTLQELIRFGQSSLTHETLLYNAQYTQTELPVRLAKRVEALQKLPFIVGTNPYISKVYNLYLSSFDTIRSVPQITSLQQDEQFAEMLRLLVESHKDNIQMLARGFQESKRYMSPLAVKMFLDEMIRARIGIRLIAEQHIALTAKRSKEATMPSLMQPSDPIPQKVTTQLGVIDTHLSPNALTLLCADFVRELCEVTYGHHPELIIDGDISTTITYVPVHLEYILTELLKNAYRASVEHANNLDVAPRPVRVTISQGPNEVGIRVRDEGGGVRDDNLHRIWDYSFTTVKNKDDLDDDAGMGGSSGAGGIFGSMSELAMQTGMGTIAGLGYGLPLARVYSEYFGGALEFISLHGYGSDVFVRLRRLELHDMDSHEI